MSIKKINVFFFAFFMLAWLACFSSAVPAADAQVVTGNTYTCYILSPLDIVNTNITFKDKGGMELSSYSGNGFYFTLTQYFVGLYWSLDQTMGTAIGDIIFLFLGTTNDPFILGTGVLTIQYNEAYPMFFFGFREVE